MSREKDSDQRMAKLDPNTFLLDLSEIRLDPDRFQSFGENRRDVYRIDLSEVTRFNEDFAGVVSVWRDPSGNALYMVDGHQRFDLATRTGTRSLSGQMLDYHTSSEAFVAGAILNIAQWVRYPNRRLWAICSRLERLQEVLDRGDILKDSRIWGQILDGIPELAETVYAHSPRAAVNRQ